VKFVFSFAFFLIFFSSTCWGGNVICPKNAYPVDFTSDFSGERRVFCQINYLGNLVNHGPEQIYARDGSLKENNYYEYGKKIARPVAEVKREVGQDFSKIARDTFAQIVALFANIHPERKNAAEEFKVWNCDTSKKSREKWAQLFLQKKPYHLNLQFNENCDAQGVVEVKLNEFFDFNVKTRNLNNVVSLKIPLLIKIEEMKLVIEGQKGLLYLEGDKEGIEFSGNYSLQLNPLKKNFIGKDLGGKVFVHRKGNKEINMEHDIWIGG